MEFTDKEKKAFIVISGQEAGQIFLKGLMRECHYQKPTLTLNGMRDLSLGLTAYYEALRGVWLDLRSLLDMDKLSIIELDEKKKAPVEIIKDVDHERSNEHNTDDTDEPSDTAVGGSVRKRRNEFERKSEAFARDYIDNLYPDTRDTSESPDSGGA